jgi:hypothetical protein
VAVLCFFSFPFIFHVIQMFSVFFIMSCKCLKPPSLKKNGSYGLGINSYFESSHEGPPTKVGSDQDTTNGFFISTNCAHHYLNLSRDRAFNLLIFFYIMDSLKTRLRAFTLCSAYMAGPEEGGAGRPPRAPKIMGPLKLSV